MMKIALISRGRLMAHVIAVVLALCFLGEAATAAGLPQGRKGITLVSTNGSRLALGHVTFTPAGEGAAITVVLDAPELNDEFLSMRPFRCLPEAKEMWCHLAYPYATKGEITVHDLADLEYALLFLYKPPTAYGIDAWNGLYFKLELDGEGGLHGSVYEVDLNVLAVPPDAADLRPISHAALTPVAPDAHRFARVEIR